MKTEPREYYQALLAAGEITADPGQEKAVAVLADLVKSLPQLTRKPLLPFLAKDQKRGVYLYGPVGRGKTMLMDMLYECTPDIPKRRIHFHEFMLEVHRRLHEARQRGEDEALKSVAAALAKEARLLCFDEF